MNASAFGSARPASGDGGPSQAVALVVTRFPRVRCPAPRPSAFLGARGGSVAIESALSLTVLITVFAGLMAIAHAAYLDDRMGRAARAAARAVALVADTSTTQATLDSTACGAIKSELDLADDVDCTTWTVSVSADLTPSSLSSGANGEGESGEMVLVEIEWRPAPWVLAVRALGSSGGRIATGVARREPSDPAAGA